MIIKSNVFFSFKYLNLDINRFGNMESLSFVQLLKHAIIYKGRAGNVGSYILFLSRPTKARNITHK